MRYGNIFFMLASAIVIMAKLPVSYSADMPLSPGTTKYIYLTFDDGPLKGSEYIDSIILASQVRANFFLIGANASNQQLIHNYSLYRLNPYIEIYNHSYSHARSHYRSFYSEPQNVLADILKNDQVLNLSFKIVRLPGRNMWRLGTRSRDDICSGSAAADLLFKNGYNIYGWDVEWNHDSTGTPCQSVDKMVAEIESCLESGNTFTKDHIVVLMHDQMFLKKCNAEKLGLLIQKLGAHTNFVFEHLRFYPDK